VLVDDGSRDGTLALLRELAAARPDRIEVVEQRPNGGKARAVRLGVLRALERSPAYVGYWDADLSTPLEMVSVFRDLLEARPELCVAMGARVALLGHSIGRSALRHYVGRVGATAISAVLGLPIYDTQCGAKLFRASRDAAELFEEPFLSRWAFDVEILARLVRQRTGTRATPPERAICEVPLPQWHDVAGSKVRAADYLGAAFDLWRIHRRYLAKRHRASFDRIHGRSARVSPPCRESL
jgi:glycosyltransferase involved in cell wall biosynthesis